MPRNSTNYKNSASFSFIGLIKWCINIILILFMATIAYIVYQHNHIFTELLGINSLLSESGTSPACSYNEINLEIAMEVENIIYSDNKALIMTKAGKGAQEVFLIDLCSGLVISKTKLVLSEPQREATFNIHNEYTG